MEPCCEGLKGGVQWGSRARTLRIWDMVTLLPARSTCTEPSQNADAAACSPSSRLSGVYTRIGGQDLAPHTSAKWMRGSSGEMACRPASSAHYSQMERGRRLLASRNPRGTKKRWLKT